MSDLCKSAVEVLVFVAEFAVALFVVQIILIALMTMICIPVLALVWFLARLVA